MWSFVITVHPPMGPVCVHISGRQVHEATWGKSRTLRIRPSLPGLTTITSPEARSVARSACPPANQGTLVRRLHDGRLCNDGAAAGSCQSGAQSITIVPGLVSAPCPGDTLLLNRTTDRGIGERKLHNAVRGLCSLGRDPSLSSVAAAASSWLRPCR